MSCRSQPPVAIVPPTRRSLLTVAEKIRSKIPTTRDLHSSSSSSGFREDGCEFSEVASSDSLSFKKLSRSSNTRASTGATAITTPTFLREYDRSESPTTMRRNDSCCKLAPHTLVNDKVYDVNFISNKSGRGSSILNIRKSNTRPNTRSTTLTTPRSLSKRNSTRGKKMSSTSQSGPHSGCTGSCKLNDYLQSNCNIYATSKYSTKSSLKSAIGGERYGRTNGREEFRLNTESDPYLDQVDAASCHNLASECDTNRRMDITSPKKRKSSLCITVRSSKQGSKSCLKSTPSSRVSASYENLNNSNNIKYLHDWDDLDELRSFSFIEVPSKVCWADLPDHDIRILRTMARRRREQRLQEQISHAFRELWREEKETRDKELEDCASEYASWLAETRRAEADCRAAARRSRAAREKRAARAHADGHRQQHVRCEQRINQLAGNKACEIWSRAAAQHSLAAAAAASRVATESACSARRQEEEARLHERRARAAANRALHKDAVFDRISAENAIAAEVGKAARAFRSSCARARANRAREHADAVAARAEGVVRERTRAARESMQMAQLTAQLRDTIRTSELFN